VDAVTEMRRGKRPSRQVVQPSGGRKGEPGKLEVKLVFFYELHSSNIYDHPGYLKCIEKPETLINVALPYLLRMTPWRNTGRPWEGQPTANYTYVYHNALSRTAFNVSTGVAEVQEITPSYQDRDPLLIMRVSEDVLWFDENPREIEWMDMNIDARSWAAVSEQ
jgi:hypothetical protein